MPWLRVDFWNVLRDVDDEPFDLFAYMRQFVALPPRQRLVDRGVEYCDFLEAPQFLDRQVCGEATRGRKVNLPGKLNVQSGARGDLGVRPDEAVDEAIHFVYDADLRVLVTQRQLVFRATALVSLLRDLGNANFHISPVLRKDKWNRVRRMESIGKVEIALKGPDHHPDFSGIMPSLNSLMDEAGQTMNAISAELTLTVGRSRQTLNVPLAKRLVDRLRREDNLDKLRVSGKSDDAAKSETVDFINDRLVFSEEAEYQGRNVGAEQCRRILQRAIEQNKDYLTGLL